MKTKVFKNRLIVASFLLPSLIGFVVFILIPIFSSILLSFSSYAGNISRLKFVGLRNYFYVFLSPIFLQSVKVTAIFVFVSVAVQVPLGFTFAVMLNERLRARNFFRAMIFLPVILSPIAIALAFMLILNPQSGPMNAFLMSIGLPALPWLASANTALATILSVAAWQNFGYYMVLFLSGLQSINTTLYEVADMDGAGVFQKLRSVTIPMLSPVTLFCVIMAVIRAFQSFDQIFIMTGGQNGGGPNGATNVLVFDIYRNAFVKNQMGVASAEAVLLLVAILAITIIQFMWQGKWVSYDIV